MGWSEMFHGTTADGQDVTVVFGEGKHEGHTLLADGHAASKTQFDRNHDHYYGNGDGATPRGAYTGDGSESTGQPQPGSAVARRIHRSKGHCSPSHRRG